MTARAHVVPIGEEQAERIAREQRTHEARAVAESEERPLVSFFGTATLASVLSLATELTRDGMPVTPRWIQNGAHIIGVGLYAAGAER